MLKITRRDAGRFIAGAGLAASVSSLCRPAIAQAIGRIVIVGGGAGGATVANRLKSADPSLSVTLIEPQQTYTTCFYSNLYIGGFKSLAELTQSYDGIAKRGITVIPDRATGIDPAAKLVSLENGSDVPYDRLVLSPGIDFKYETIDGYSQEAAEQMPHAWKGGSQTSLLKQKLLAMSDGGLVVVAPPPNPYRCPPGPYERVCMIAHFLKTKKPRSKLILFDPKKTFSKQSVFEEAFADYYRDIIEVNLTNEIDDFALARVDAETGEVVTKAGRKEKAAVANIIPAQKAGAIAHQMGCAQGDWCPVDPANFRSSLVPDVYVIGDSAIAADMPKSAYAAHNQAGVVASDIVADLSNGTRIPGRYRNTCWSLLAPQNSVKIGADYTPAIVGGKTILQASDSFVSKPGESSGIRLENMRESLAWYDSLVIDMFAKDAPVLP